MKLEQTLAIWPLPENFRQTAPFYREALADVPADLVDIALRHVRLNSKWFPKPSELREPIKDLLWERRRRLDDLEREARQIEPPTRKPSEQDRAKVTAVLDEWRKKRVISEPLEAGE